MGPNQSGQCVPQETFKQFAVCWPFHQSYLDYRKWHETWFLRLPGSRDHVDPKAAKSELRVMRVVNWETKIMDPSAKTADLFLVDDLSLLLSESRLKKCCDL